jgi:hypothetical protein
MMNPQIDSEKTVEMLSNVETVTTELDALTEAGFSAEEILSLQWLRQWYQSGGSDRVEIIRRLEFLKLLVLNGKIEL